MVKLSWTGSVQVKLFLFSIEVLAHIKLHGVRNKSGEFTKLN